MKKNNYNDVLVAIVSGKRPGTFKERPTEQYIIKKYNEVIISNNSEGYVTELPIINVPDDYRQQYYQDNMKISYEVPLSRSYALKYAKEQGYKYLVQLDDNILNFSFKILKKNKIGSSVKQINVPRANKFILEDIIDYMLDVINNTNAGIVGINIAGCAHGEETFLREGYVYSCIIMRTDLPIKYYHSGFEEDIEIRYKLKEANIPMLMIPWIRYAKTSQHATQDTTGNRISYVKAGVKRGEIMRKLYPQFFTCGLSTKSPGKGKNLNKEHKLFYAHRLKTFKIGFIINNKDYLIKRFKELIQKYEQKTNS